ncbi:MAG: hypothetical protein PVF69_06010 [Gemmatimonadota bacterium]|jgi:hypothetical protein
MSSSRSARSRRVLSLFVLISVALGAVAIAACRRRPAANTGTIQGQPQGAPAAVGTTLTPDEPPLCGDFGRAYLAPGSRGQSNPAAPPRGLGTVGPLDSRIYREGDGFKTYTDQDQELIRSGRARVGLDERAVYLANGLPAFYWNTQIDDRRCRVLLYGILGEPKVDTAVYSCDGVITHIGPVQPQLPCWRLEEVAPRAVERAPHFDSVGVDRQWEIMHGLLVRGQSKDDVYVAFGEPYRTGIEAREDGTNASQHVYLDRAGDAYSLYLTFVDESLRGWRFPPDRQLTPEAEQRRLDAMERRMMDQMREMEAQSMARHQEQLAHMNDIQANQEQIRSDIANARTAITSTVIAEGAATRGTVRNEGARTRDAVESTPTQSGAGGAGGGRATGSGGNGGGGGGGGNRPPPSGCKRFTLNGVTWSDHHGTPMGTQCGGNHGGCPDGYTCISLGRCMPESPRRRCN